MIPKTLHYCWFGGNEKSSTALKCIETWELYLPDYQFIEWNEKTYPLKHPFLKNAANAKLWAFVADFARIDILNKYGGVYLDTDMLFLKSIPETFLDTEAFMGFEDFQHIGASIIGTIPNGDLIKKLADYYMKLIHLENIYDLTIPKIVTRIVSPDLANSMIVDYKGLKIYPPEYFYPLPYTEKGADWKNFKTEKSFCVHLWEGSWLNPEPLSKIELMKKEGYLFLSKFFGPYI